MNHCNCPLKEKEDQFQIVNNWTKTIGNHAVKFGADLRYARNLRVPSDTDRTGDDNFANGPTSNGTTGGLGFASFILGDVVSFQPLHQHLDQRQGVSGARLLLRAGHLAVSHRSSP